MTTTRIWAVRAGAANQVDHIFMGRNQLAVNFSDVGGDVSALPANRGAFRAVFDRAAVRPEAAPIQAGQLFRFVHEMHIGDRVVYPRKIDRMLMWGEVAGPYVYDPDGAPDYAHRRSVRWHGQLSRDAFSQGALYELGSVLTLFEVKSFADEFRLRFERGNGETAHDDDETAQVVVKDIVETTRDFIFKRLKTDLKGFPLEGFVADLFRAMGYRAHATRSVHDDGVDVIAHRDELGIEPPILKIQVKGREGNIGADPVKAFCAMVQERDVGLYVTIGGYTAAARDFARTRGNLKLIDGIEFIDLIQKYYDRLDRRHRQLIPLRRLLVPDVPTDED